MVMDDHEDRFVEQDKEVISPGRSFPDTSSVEVGYAGSHSGGAFGDPREGGLLVNDETLHRFALERFGRRIQGGAQEGRQYH